MTFVITGGGSGIGKATAAVAAARGARVFVGDLSADAAEQTAQDIRATGGAASSAYCDVTDERSVQTLMESAAATFGGIDVLHNNAGVHETGLIDPALCTVESMPLAIFRRVLEVNTVGPWLCTKHCLPFLKKSAYASVINSGSVSSQCAYPGNTAYGASKGGVRLLTQNLAVDLAPFRIRVNCYGPAAIRTKMVTDFSLQAPDAEEFERTIAKTHLIPRLGLPAEVARLVCFLASQEASFINGAFFLIDGGSLAWRYSVDQIGML